MTDKLPPDPDDQNDDRADWANTAIDSFMHATGTEINDVLSDLLADLMHWADRNNQDFNAELARGNGCYKQETDPAGGW